MMHGSKVIGIHLPLLLLTLIFTPAQILAEGVVIGVILPMSGSHASLGHMQKNSMLLAVEEINSTGAISGEPLQLDIRDSRGQIRTARTFIDHFVKDKQYAVVLGGFSSKVAVSLAEKCEQRRIPLVLMTGSEDAITLQEQRFVFRIAPPRSRYLAAALDFAATGLDISRAALIMERSSYGDSMARTVRKAAREAKWELSGDWKFEIGSRNLESLYAEASKTEPDAIFMAAFPPDGSKIVRELRGILPDTVIFNLVPASTTAGSYAQCGEPCRYVLNPSLWQPGVFKSGVRYKEKYLARFGSEPDYHGAQAYAAVLVAAQAIRRSGVAEPEPVRDALESISVNTPYGKVSFRQFDGFVNQYDPLNYLVQWSGTGFEVVWPERYRTASPVLPKSD
jgi:branched-chain amino acid transport system substrate-binding protein